MAAQEWGARPQQWTAETLEFSRYSGVPESGTSPQDCSTPGSRLHSRQHIAPSPFCRWAIHLNDSAAFFELQWNEASAVLLQPEVHLAPAFNEQPGDALRTGSFTDVDSASLPLGITQIVNKSVRTSNELLTEAIAFAIMGRNVTLLANLLEDAGDALLDLTGIHPLHLATSYLDGGSTCCLVVNRIMYCVLDTGPLRRFLINDHGHTVLDNLLLSILRSHTSTPIRGVDTALGQGARYAGQEVDICGRWTADSPYFRALVARGMPEIPATWKHKFCHSSAQAVSHCASSILYHCPVNLVSDSGLFQRRCLAPSCGKLLVLGPLHALVVTALHLVTSGFDGEDLFGVLAYYLTLIQAGLDATTRAEISVDLIVGSDASEDCRHEELTPACLAREFEYRMQPWPISKSCVTGWGALLAVMEAVENEQRTFAGLAEAYGGESNLSILFNHNDDAIYNSFQDPDDLELRNTTQDQAKARALLHASFPQKCDYHHFVSAAGEFLVPAFRNSPLLGHVWAGVQAELASYRRLDSHEGWTSSQFSMEKLWFSIRNSSKPDIEHLQDPNLSDYCRCGRFFSTEARGIGIQSPQDVFE